MNQVVRTEEPRAPVAPVVDVREDRDGYTMTIELPGVDEADVNLSVEDRTLMLDAESHIPAPEGYTLLRQEIPPIRYHAVFELPDRVDIQAIKSTLRNGLLTVGLPKREEVKPRRVPVAST